MELWSGSDVELTKTCDLKVGTSGIRRMEKLRQFVANMNQHCKI
jgi:hypothetical protein